MPAGRGFQNDVGWAWCAHCGLILLANLLVGTQQPALRVWMVWILFEDLKDGHRKIVITGATISMAEFKQYC